MSNRTLAITVCLAVLAAALAWVTTPERRASAARAADEPETFTLGFDVASVSAVLVESGGFTAVLSRYPHWLVQLPGENGGAITWPAEPDAARSLLRDLAAVRFEPRETPDAAGRVLTRIHVDVLDVPDGRTITIEVLGPPLAGRVPVRIATPDGSRYADAPVNQLRPLSIEDIASLVSPYPLAPDGVVSTVYIMAIGPDGQLSTDLRLQRQAGLWALSDSEARLDPAAIGALIDRLRSIRMAQVEVPVRDDILDPRYVIIVRASLPRAAGEPEIPASGTLTIGSQVNIDGDVRAKVVSTVNGGQYGCFFTLDAKTFPALPTTPDTLLDKVPLPWPASEAATIAVERGGKAASVRRTIEGWVARDHPADTLAIRTLLAALGSPQAVRLHADSDVAPTERLTLGPIGMGDQVTLAVTRDGSSVIVSDGAADWTIDDKDGSIGRSLDALAP
ncbi:MAG: hypothetical protein H6810_05430 [Phycisphaeraceae bacterium]|nr:MAG: hypothetical protein H6810_05430 [Phycisphaeraceae bacterium]